MNIEVNRNPNVDKKTVEGFADEWLRFDQAGLSLKEHHEAFQLYFSIFPWEKLPKDAIDVPC